MEIEVKLQIPAIKDPLKDAAGWPIHNADVRFSKRVTVSTLPKPGDTLDLKVQPDHLIQATVVRADWHEEKEMFVVTCKYAGRSISRPDYVALMADHEWTMRRLLE